jgi:predicted transcriptional regulator
MQDSSSNPDAPRDDILRHVSEVVASYVGRNEVAPEALPELIRSVHQAMQSLAEKPAPRSEERPKPAVPVNRSVTKDYIICLEDGRKLKMLKRYLRSRYDMSPDDYRRRWGLPPDYPMVAPAYTETRSEMAKRIGLGRGVRKLRKP